MVDRLKDNEDLKLEALFRSEPLADDGFSVAVVSRVKRRMWIRRLSLPMAIGLGAAISAKPILQVASVVPGLVTSIFGSTIDIDRLPLADLPQFSTMLFGASIIMAIMLASRILEE